jgi:large subunit ribosomal protein L15
MPKRGFTNAVFKKRHSTINVSDLARFDKGAKVGPQELVERGLLRRIAAGGLRILGDGQLEQPVHVSAHYFTESAREKITKAGGTCEVIAS